MPKKDPRRSLWISLLGFEEDHPFPKYVDLCSKHFRESDFVDAPDGYRHIKFDAVPIPVHSAFDSARSVSPESSVSANSNNSPDEEQAVISSSDESQSEVDVLAIVPRSVEAGPDEKHMEITKPFAFGYELCSSKDKIEENQLPQVKSEQDIIDEEVAENKCFLLPTARIKEEFAYTDEEVVENKCVLSPTARIKDEFAYTDDQIVKNKWLMAPSARIKEEFAYTDDEVTEIKCFLPSTSSIKEEFAYSDDNKNDALDIEHMVKNELESDSPDSSTSTISAPETRAIEGYLAMYLREQITDGQFAECITPTTNSCYLIRLPKEEIHQNMSPKSEGPIRSSSESDDDTFSDGLRYGSGDSKHKERQKMS
ncbi:unnamed protein product [Callosobruchus maculatus]|uniref:THAP-type domain-containing protein n=1 Tax=Callosobruchus maculatus TaxID=64391 RepID=A0A653BG22_CALMS|nr:unnamed protein product [Callosobruchus maculatus]